MNQRETFSGVTLLREESGFDFVAPKTKKWTLSAILMPFTLFLSLLAICLSISALAHTDDDTSETPAVLNEGLCGFWMFSALERGCVVVSAGQMEYGLIQTADPISKNAFGSCFTHYLFPQTIRTRGHWRTL